MGKILAPFRYPHVGACCKVSVRFELVPETSSRYVPLAPSGKISHGASGGAYRTLFKKILRKTCFTLAEARGGGTGFWVSSQEISFQKPLVSSETGALHLLFHLLPRATVNVYRWEGVFLCRRVLSPL